MQSRLVGNVQLVAGDANLIPEVLALLKDNGMKVEGNPDVYVREYKYFSVDDARELRERASLRPLGERRVFIIAAPDMNHNAQNALLKILEEPSANALFFFIVPAPHALLATLRSRAQMLTLGAHAGPYSMIDTKEFLSATPHKRLEMLKPLLEKDEDEKRDLGAILAFLSSLEQTLAHSTNSGQAKKPEGLHAVYRARKYMGDKGALVKPLLEQIALLI
ncbi:MAG: hypothetical protein Q7S50_04665 [bacterium]|nr:hypothetical protein [bacterium]